MKLYTEEQVKQIVEKSRETGLTAEYLMLTHTSIQLPSDDEITTSAEKHTCYMKDFIQGAKWLRDNIRERMNG